MLISKRETTEKELLDTQCVPYEEIARSLLDLERANRWLGGRRAVFSRLSRHIGKCDSFLDVGCGSGDILRSISDSSDQQGTRCRLVGIDLSPQVLSIATERCKNYKNIELVSANATSLPFDDKSFDVIVASTFLHHLSREEAVQFFLEAKRVARKEIIVVDLIRSNLCLLGVWLVGRIAFGKVSKYDGVISVKKAFRSGELREICMEAGIENPRVKSSICRMTAVCELQ